MNLDLLPDDKPHHIFNELNEAIDFPNKQDHTKNIFIIGGERVFKSILELNLCDRIYLKKVLKNMIVMHFIHQLINKTISIN